MYGRYVMSCETTGGANISTILHKVLTESAEEGGRDAVQLHISSGSKSLQNRSLLKVPLNGLNNEQWTAIFILFG